MEQQLTEVTVQPIDLAAWAPYALEVQSAAFGLSPEEVAVRLHIVGRHALQPGVIALGALSAGQLVGFGYGMPNQREHWWSTVIEPHLEARGHGDWLDGVFAVTELHVLPQFQGRGLGSTLIRTLCERSGCRAASCPRSTPRPRPAASTARSATATWPARCASRTPTARTS